MRLSGTSCGRADTHGPDALKLRSRPPATTPYSDDEETETIELTKCATASLEDSKKYLSETLAFLATVKPEDLNGKEDKLLKAQLGPGYEPETTAFNYVQGYLLPNIYFHLTTLYNLLRGQGVPLGKKDYISGFVRLA